MRYLITRNLKLYYRDRMSVFFSMLSVLITIGLYAFFLADNLLESGSLANLEANEVFLNTWILGGILSTVSVTTTLASFSTMVNDRVVGIMKDFYSSPIKRAKLVLSYIIAACIIGVVMSIFTLIIGEFYILSSGGDLITMDVLLKLLGLILIAVMAGSSMMFFLSSLLKTDSSFANASTLVGTLNGFIMGIYMPVGALPEFAQSLLKFFPLSHGCALYRDILLEVPIQNSLENAPAEVITQLKEMMGITLSINGTLITPIMSIGILLASTILFFALSTIVLKRKASSK